MPDDSSHLQSADGRDGGEPERSLLAARDRVMLYLRGMDMGALPSLELAAKTMRRAGPEAGPEQAMAALWALLEKQNPSICLADSGGAILRSTPPLNRRPMLSGKMGELTLYGAGKKLLSNALGMLNLKESPWNRRRA